jgi:hypothetical protein
MTPLRKMNAAILVPPGVLYHFGLARRLEARYFSRQVRGPNPFF